MDKTIKTLAISMISLLAASSSLQGVDFGRQKAIKDIPAGDAASVAYTSNDFGFKVFKLIAANDQAFFSPISLNEALAMTAVGAKGKTADAMAAAMGFRTQGTDQLAEGFSAIAKELTGKDRAVKLTMANSIWVDNSLALKKDFVNKDKSLFGADVVSEDFKSPATVSKINQWCSNQTNGKIESIIDRIDPMMKMYLFNALYFKGKWMDPFNATIKDRFTCLDGSRIRVDMMLAERYYQYCENEYFQFAEIPYEISSAEDSHCSMIIALPKGDFSKAVNSLDAASWEKMYNSLSSTKLDLKMPKFTIEFETVLNDALKSLGMEIAFSNNADFGGISDFPLSIGTVKQKTYVNVDENGSEAAAVTAIGMRAMAARPEPSIEFFADKPFVFAICDRATGAILFLGQKVR